MYNRTHGPPIQQLAVTGEIFVKSKWWVFGVVALLCLIGSVALGYSSYQATPPTGSSVFIEVTKTIFLCLGGIGVLLPITLNVTNAIEQRRFDRIENTFQLIGKWDDPHLLAARNYTRKIGKLKSQISDDDLVKQIEGEESLEQSVILVTNYFEHVRYSLKNNRIDASALQVSLGATIIKIIDRFWPYYEKQPAAVCTDLKELKELLK